MLLDYLVPLILLVVMAALLWGLASARERSRATVVVLLVALVMTSLALTIRIAPLIRANVFTP